MTTMPDDNRSMRERMLAGDLYRGADDELVAEMEQAMRLTMKYNDSDPGDTGARRSILNELLGDIGEEVDIRPPLHCHYGSHIRVRVAVDGQSRKSQAASDSHRRSLDILTPAHPQGSIV